MNFNQLKYAEILSFLAFIFFILFILSYNLNVKQNKDDLAPIIIDEKAGKFHFETGKATLKEDLKAHIKDKVVPDIENKFKNNQGAIDTIEVIGHTDGQPITTRTINIHSNLDEYINKVARGEESIEKLIPGSNADLGLMRAIAVVKELKRIKKEGKGLKVLDEFKSENKVFRAYSAGQLTDIEGQFAEYDTSDKEGRRRIEIRFTKLNYKEN